jgi:Mrp family chromosome partitioning ATPase
VLLGLWIRRVTRLQISLQDSFEDVAHLERRLVKRKVKVTQEETPSEQADREDAEARVAERMTRVGHKIVVLSGKGGVGKSTVAVNLATALRDIGKRTGLLDIDVHGPSVPTLLGLEGKALGSAPDGGIKPIESDGLRVMSIGFFLQGKGDAVIWRGPMKHGVIRQLLSDVDWGDLDYLVIDAPPGTGDEPLSICQLLPDADGAVVVTTPQAISVSDVRRSIDFCRKINMRVLGVIENMSGFVCPKCGERIEIFKVGGGKKLALEMGVPFLGAIPLDPVVVDASDSGVPFVAGSAESETAKAFFSVVDVLLQVEHFLDWEVS